VTDAARRWGASYRARLTFGYLAIVAVFAVAWAWTLFGPLEDTVIEQQEDHLLAVAQAGALVLGETTSRPADFAQKLVARTNLRVTVVASDGVVLADNEEDPAEMENHGDRPEVRSALAGEPGIDRRVSETQDTERIYVAVPSSYDGQRVALRVSSSLEEVNAVAAQARRTGLILLAIALVFAAIVVTRLTAVATEPVMRLSRSAEAMAAGNLRAHVPQEGGELRVLSVALSELREQMNARLGDLEAEKRNLRAVLDGLTEAVLLLHGDRIQFTNTATDRLFRRPSGGWRDRPYDDAGLPASVQGAISTHMARDQAAAEECGPDPNGRYLRVTVLPLNPTDEHSRTLVSIADITERTRVDRVRRDFVANASHELKTPVAGIHLLAESAADAASAGEVDQAMVFARQIANESERLGRLVRDLLDLSRLESAAEPGSVTDAREAIENALLGHGPEAQSRELALVFDDSPATGTDAYVAADPTDIAVALDNLLDNAIKYTEHGGVTISLEVTDDAVSISVTDTGIGIPPQDLPRIFERFYRVDRARSRESGGTGLGLALVRHVAERANGTLEVSSEEGVGSTFRMNLPRAR